MSWAGMPLAAFHVAEALERTNVPWRNALAVPFVELTPKQMAALPADKVRTTEGKSSLIRLHNNRASVARWLRLEQQWVAGFIAATVEDWLESSKRHGTSIDVPRIAVEVEWITCPDLGGTISDIGHLTFRVMIAGPEDAP